jgi:hypothetical protein
LYLACGIFPLILIEQNEKNNNNTLLEQVQYPNEKSQKEANSIPLIQKYMTSQVETLV